MDMRKPGSETPSPDRALTRRRWSNAGATALSVLAVLALIFSLQWARNFFIPLVFGILIAYTLNPVVAWFARKMPRIVAVYLVTLGVLASTAVMAISVYNEVQSIMDEVPTATYKLSQVLRHGDYGELNTLDKLHNVADALKQATRSTSVESVATPERTPVFNINDWLWSGALSALALAGQLTMVAFLVFFALLSGDTFKRKLVKLAGPSLSDKKITIRILDDINTTIQRYMFMLLVTNVLLALVTWLALRWIGLANPGAWAVAAGLFHVIPYFGTVAAALAMGFAAFLQFGSFSMMLLVGCAFLVIATIVGMLITTWMTGRIARMNPSAVFVALLFGQWLWGIWGMLLCIPLIVVIKVISERVEGMQTIAELLGE